METRSKHKEKHGYVVAKGAEPAIDSSIGIRNGNSGIESIFSDAGGR